MVKRNIIEIDEKKCNGCGQCVPNCHEGALQIIDKKARLISDLFCDGLGACIGHCPEGAIKVIEREAEPYDERKVMEDNIVPKGENTIKAHLNHLKEHGATDFYNEAIEYLKEKGIKMELEEKKSSCGGGGCPGSKMMDLRDDKNDNEKQDAAGFRISQLKQWPVQMHLISPSAPYFKKSDLLVASDCSGYALGDFHKDFLKGKSLVIACPKLDSDLNSYVEKFVGLIDEAEVNTITILRMEVPCCGGLTQMIQEAISKAKRKVPVKEVIVGIDGSIKGEDWI